jgi:hypothetical protein
VASFSNNCFWNWFWTWHRHWQRSFMAIAVLSEPRGIFFPFHGVLLDFNFWSNSAKTITK